MIGLRNLPPPTPGPTITVHPEAAQYCDECYLRSGHDSLCSRRP